MNIPYYHFDPPADKLKPEWAMKVVGDTWYRGAKRHLLHGKKLEIIEQFATGDIDMRPYMRMFQSLKKAMDDPKNQGPMGMMNMRPVNETEIDFKPVPLIPLKLNAAVASITKTPLEVTVTAQDALATQKRKEDLEFLKNKPAIEADLQPIADQLNIGKVDLGPTKHSFRKLGAPPMGLDLTQPDQEEVFTKMLYALRVEVALEKALTQLAVLKKRRIVRKMEANDQLKYGVSAHRNFQSSITGMLDHEYVFPGDISVETGCRMPDYSDRSWQIQDMRPTVLELFNMFQGEIGTMDDLERIINGPVSDWGYCAKNGHTNQDPGVWGTFRVNLKRFEVKSVDYVGIGKRKGKRMTSTYLTDDPAQTQEKLWAQNTYVFYWLTNTKQIFGIHRLGYAHRERGNESFQNFSTCIYKTQEKSAVELCISENVKAQIADIKLQFALLRALPSGTYLDLRFMRNALTGLKEDAGKYTMNELLSLLFEKNTMVADTTGFEGKNDANFKPFERIPGGLDLKEISGYFETLSRAADNVSRYTGINDQLTGQGTNPEGLVGLQKLLINSATNAIYYISDALREQEEPMFNTWVYSVESSLKAGGATKQAIVDMVGTEDAQIIEGLNEVPLHKLTAKVVIGMREVERQMFENRLNMLVEKGIITTAEETLVREIDNPKERIAYLGVLEKKFMDKQDQIRQEGYANQQQMLQQQQQGDAGMQQMQGQQDINAIYAKGDVTAKLMQLADSLGMNSDNRQMMVKRILQQDRSNQQISKTLAGIKANADATAQTATV